MMLWIDNYFNDQENVPKTHAIFSPEEKTEHILKYKGKSFNLSSG